MSEVTQIKLPQNFARQDILMKAVQELQSAGFTDILTAEQFTEQYHRPAAAHFYFHGHAQYNKAPGAEREGEKLSVVLNAEAGSRWGDVVGISAERGDLVGGVHRLGTPEGEQSSCEKTVEAQSLALRGAYNRAIVHDVANQISEASGATVEWVDANYCQIHIGSSNALGGML